VISMWRIKVKEEKKIDWKKVCIAVGSFVGLFGLIALMRRG